MDNAFGGEVLPAFDASNLHVQESLNAGVEGGSWTLALHVETDGKALVSWATSSVQPSFDGSDVWSPITETALSGTARVWNGSLVVRAPRLELPFRSDYLGPRMVLLDAVLAVSLAVDNGTHAGVLGGVAAPGPLVFELHEALARGDPGKCPPWMDRIADQFADTRFGGSEKCTHVSIGARASFVPAAMGTSVSLPPIGPTCQ